MRDAARTSPWSHVVVEKVLYACVCLSVPLRIFTRRRRGPAICSNIPYLLFYYPLTSLADSHFLLPFFYFAVAVVVVSRCLCFIHESSLGPTLTPALSSRTFYVLVCDWTEAIIHPLGEDDGVTGRIRRQQTSSHKCWRQRLLEVAALACRASPDLSPQNPHFQPSAGFTFASVHPLTPLLTS